MASGNSSCTPRAGDTVDAYVLRVSRDAAYVDICCEREIAIPKSKLAYPEPEFAADVVNVGDVFPVYIESLGGENGGVLSRVKADDLRKRAIDTHNDNFAAKKFYTVAAYV